MDGNALAANPSDLCFQMQTNEKENICYNGLMSVDNMNKYIMENIDNPSDWMKDVYAFHANFSLIGYLKSVEHAQQSNHEYVLFQTLADFGEEVCIANTRIERGDDVRVGNNVGIRSEKRPDNGAIRFVPCLLKHCKPGDTFTPVGVVTRLAEPDGCSEAKCFDIFMSIKIWPVLELKQEHLDEENGL